MVRPSHDLHQSWLGRFYLRSNFYQITRSIQKLSRTLRRTFVCLPALFARGAQIKNSFFVRFEGVGAKSSSLARSQCPFGNFVKIPRPANFLRNSSRIAPTKEAGATLVWPRPTDHTCGYGSLLSPVQGDEIWRMRIAWPNGAVHHFGKFSSERDATDWINAHPRLTKPEDTMG